MNSKISKMKNVLLLYLNKFKGINSFLLFCGMIISIAVMLLLFFSKNSMVSSEIIVGTISSTEAVCVNCIENTGESFKVTGSNSYFIIPFSEKYNEVELNVNYDGNEDCYIRIWYSGSKDGWSIYNSMSKKIDDLHGRYKYQLPEYVSGNLKIQIVSENGQEIEIDNIDFIARDIFVSVKGIVATIGFAILLGLLIAIFIKYDGGDKSTTKLFFRILLLGTFIFGVINYITSNYYLDSYFFPDSNNSFMDYFNMLALLNNDNPYYLDASYPALCFVILKIMHNFLSYDLKLITTGSGLRSDAYAMLGFVVLLIICIYFILSIIKKYLNEDDSKIYAFSILLSGPFLYTVQRGNLIIISLAFLLVYCLYYNSDNKRLRYIAYIALAISASIKIYPALFGLMTLKSKRVKETIHLAVIGFAGFMIPFFAFDGINSLKAMLNGLQVANDELTSGGVGQNFCLTNFCKIIGAIFDRNITISQGALIGITICLLLLAFLAKKEWQSLFLIATACIWFPQFSFTYVLVFYLPACLSSIKNQDENKVDVVLLAMLQIPYALPYMPWIDEYVGIDGDSKYMSYSTLILNVLVLIIVIRISIAIISNLIPITIMKNTSLKIAAVFNVILILVLLVGLSNNGAKEYSNLFEGKGTKSNPYEIATTDDFLLFADMVNQGENFEGIYFEQTADLIFDEEIAMAPIGMEGDSSSFSGTYDGQGYRISNYYVESESGAGIFYNLSGTIYNIQFDSCYIRGEVIGGIAYKISSEGKIVNCGINGLIHGYKVAGIAAYNSGTIENCFAFVSIDLEDDSNVVEEGVADNLTGAYIINSYSSLEGNVYAMTLIDGNTLEKLNSHVNLNNSIWNVNYKMYNWIMTDGYIRLSR